MGDSYWQQAWDEENEAYYYVDSNTGESTWDMPDEYWGLDENWHTNDESNELKALEEDTNAKANETQNQLLVSVLLLNTIALF